MHNAQIEKCTHDVNAFHQVELFKSLLCGCHFDSRVNVCAGLVHFEAQNFCFCLSLCRFGAL